MTMNKNICLAKLHNLGIRPKGLQLDLAAAYVGLSPPSFLIAVEKGLLPAPRVFGGRKIWSTDLLDRALNGESGSPPSDAYMAAIHAHQDAKVR